MVWFHGGTIRKNEQKFKNLFFGVAINESTINDIQISG
jgi:hypothetical protein